MRLARVVRLVTGEGGEISEVGVGGEVGDW